MARISQITFGQVATIADAMKAAGNRPTARAVRERIGSGSMGTIHKLLQQWQGNGSAEEIEAAELPESIASALMDFVSTEVATACEPLNTQLRHAKENADEIALDNERIWRDLTQAGEDLEQCRQERAAALAQLNMTRDELKNANKAREALGEANTALLRDLDRAQRQIEMLASYAPDLAKAQTDLATANAHRIDAERSKAVLTAQLNATTERANDLAERLASTEKRNAMQEAELKAAGATAQRATAELSAVARELADLKTQPAKIVKSTAKKATPKKPSNQELAV